MELEKKWSLHSAKRTLKDFLQFKKKSNYTVTKKCWEDRVQGNTTFFKVKVQRSGAQRSKSVDSKSPYKLRLKLRRRAVQSVNQFIHLHYVKLKLERNKVLTFSNSFLRIEVFMKPKRFGFSDPAPFQMKWRERELSNQLNVHIPALPQYTNCPFQVPHPPFWNSLGGPCQSNRNVIKRERRDGREREREREREGVLKWIYNNKMWLC